MEQVTLSRILQNLLIVVIIISAMIFASAWLIPVSWAFLFACLLCPVCVYVENKGVNRTITSIFVTVSFCVIMIFILYFLIMQAFLIIKTNDNVLHKIKKGVESGILFLQSKVGVEFYHQNDLRENLSTMIGKGIGVISGQLSSIGANVLTIALTPVFLFFILNLRGLVKEFLLKNYTGTDLKNIQDFVIKSLNSVKNYLWGTMILTLVTAVMTYIILMLFGIKSAIFLVSFLPYLILSHT